MTGSAIERADTGAAAFLSPGELYQRARKVQQLATIILDCTCSGCALRDVVRATSIMAEIGAIVGGATTDHG